MPEKTGAIENRLLRAAKFREKVFLKKGGCVYTYTFDITCSLPSLKWPITVT